MTNKLSQIKKLVKNECTSLGFAGSWFYDVHLLAVEKFAKELLKKYGIVEKKVKKYSKTVYKEVFKKNRKIQFSFKG